MPAFLPPSPLRLTHQTRQATSHHPILSPKCTLNDSATESSALTAAAATFILKRAAETYQHGGPRPRAFTVLEALRQLERTQKKMHFKADMTKLEGQWRLIFSGDVRKKLQTCYFPVRAHQTFREGLFDNGVFLFGGAMSFRVVGPMRFGGRNRMEFTVNKVDLKLGGLKWGKDGLDPKGDTLEGRSVKDLPFFNFFLLRDDLAAARGRSGGLALYARVPEDQHL